MASDKKPLILEMHGDNICNVMFSSKLKGSTFHSPAQEVLKVLKRVNPKDIILRLEREPDNEYDENAVAIYVTITGAKQEYKVGYFPKEGAPLISYVLKHNSEYKLIITNVYLSGGVENKEYVGLFFDFRINKINIDR
jgi:hypothetical protein